MLTFPSIPSSNSVEIHKKREETLLKNSFLEIKTSNIGASIKNLSLCFPDSSFKNIALTLTSLPEGGVNSLYAGATLAPYAGRIRSGILSVNGELFQLDRNENDITHLHGGSHNLSFQNWEIIASSETSIHYESFLPDGTDGYPGNRSFHVSYSLEGTDLIIRQCADSDKATCFNLSNHTYFNLNAFNRPGLLQYLRINADTFVRNDAAHIPVQKCNVANSPFDLRTPLLLTGQLCRYSQNHDLVTSKGYNHYFLLEKAHPSIPACTLLSEDKKISMKLFTDAPAVVFYSGGFIDNHNLFSYGDQIQRTYPGCAIALEPCEFPLNFRDFAGQTSFRRTIRLSFSSTDQ